MDTRKVGRFQQLDDEAAAYADDGVLVQLAEEYRAAGEHDRALSVLRRCLEANGRYVPAYVLMGRVLVEQTRFPEAVATFERVLELDPENRDAFAALTDLFANAPKVLPRRKAGARPIEPVRRDPILDAKRERPRRLDPALSAIAEAEQVATNGRPGTAHVDATAVALADLLVGLLEYRDPFFRGGTSLTRLLTSGIARELKLPPEEVNAYALAAVLRDLGQVPLKNLIATPGAELDLEGRRRIEVHVETTLELLTAINLPESVRETIRHHHERFDGTGYPDGLKGEDIPLGARIVAVADSFGAMISARPHRLPHSVSATLDEVMGAAGTAYDPAVVDALVRVLTTTDWRGIRFGLRHHLLIVDPDETRAMVLTTKLCSNGYLAEAAFELDAVRERLEHSKIAGLILSAELPERDAFTLLREIRGIARLGMTPVIMTDAEPAERVDLLEAGADVCLAKPSTFEELKATLEAFLRREEKTLATRLGDMPWAGLKGELQDFPLPWLLQMLNADSRNAAIFVMTANEKGVIYVQNGNPSHARTKHVTGEEAFRYMLRWEKGSFTVDPEARSTDQTINTPLMNLLLEQALEDDRAAFFGKVKT